MRRACLYCVHHPQQLIKAADEEVKNQNTARPAGHGGPGALKAIELGRPLVLGGEIASNTSHGRKCPGLTSLTLQHIQASVRNLFFHNVTFFVRFFCQRDLRLEFLFTSDVCCVVLRFIVLVYSSFFLFSG